MSKILAVHSSPGAFGRLFVFVAFLTGFETAFGGSPPLVTDDPGTPGKHGWEVNITSGIESTREEVTMDVPLFDINYGVNARDQLKVEFAFAWNDPGDAGARWGIGDLLVGYKYRFLDDNDGGGWSVSIYPQVSSPTGNARFGLGSGSTELLIPFEFEKPFFNDHVRVNPALGYNVVFEDNDANNVNLSLAVAWAVTGKLEMMGEAGALIFPRGTEPDNPFFNIGFAYDLSEHAALLGSAGRSFQDRNDGAPDLIALLGFQLIWGAAGEVSPGSSGGSDEEK